MNTLVINGFPGIDFYFQGFDYTYIPRENQRYVAYACRRGTTERWGNLPLLDDIDDLDTLLQSTSKILIVINPYQWSEIAARFGPRRSEIEWVSPDRSIFIGIVRSQAPSRSIEPASVDRE